METNAVRRDRHQRLLHPTLFGRGHMGSGPEQIMRGTETWGHACTIRKANGLLAVMGSPMLCVVVDSALYLLCTAFCFCVCAS